MLTAGRFLCLLLATIQAPTSTLGDGFAGTRVRVLGRILDVASGLADRPTPGPHRASPFTYGETASGPSSQYNGRVFDPETGFHDYGARMYWPQIGRFISADSVMGSTASPMTLNRYSYVLNNPYKYTDPTGKAPNQAGATDWHHVAGALQSGSLSQLSASHGTNASRYFFTEKFGWVDIRHFGAAASQVADKGMPGPVVKAMGYGVEVQQWMNEGPNDYQSAFSPEDIPSNSAGVDFAQSIGKGESPAEAFPRWVLGVGGKELSESGREKLPATDPSMRNRNSAGKAKEWSSGNPNSQNPDRSKKQ